MILIKVIKLKSSLIEKNELKKDKKVSGGIIYMYVLFKILRLDNLYII